MSLATPGSRDPPSPVIERLQTTAVERKKSQPNLTIGNNAAHEHELPAATNWDHHLLRR